MIRLGELPTFNTIGLYERLNLLAAMQRPLSGYLGGKPRGGYWVERLASEWSRVFDVKHAVPCNSATSGLLAACMAAEIMPGDIVWTTAYSMSATAACALVLGADVRFIDIEPLRFSINMNMLPGGPPPKAIIVTNLFGHPAYLGAMRSWCNANKVIMIEDNAQAPFATEGGKFAGTIGHMGVFSLNVHKALQAGEGGVVVTDDSDFADLLRGAINHGELANIGVGLNLRMTEPIAAIACAQLAKGPEIIEGRREIGLALNDMVNDIPFIEQPREYGGCKHVFYIWAAKVSEGKRDKVSDYLIKHGVPVRNGYSMPLNQVFKTNQVCPIAQNMEQDLITFEVCAYSPTKKQMRQMRDIFKGAAEAAK